MAMCRRQMLSDDLLTVIPNTLICITWMLAYLLTYIETCSLHVENTLVQTIESCNFRIWNTVVSHSHEGWAHRTISPRNSCSTAWCPPILNSSCRCWGWKSDLLVLPSIGLRGLLYRQTGCFLEACPDLPYEHYEKQKKRQQQTEKQSNQTTKYKQKTKHNKNNYLLTIPMSSNLRYPYYLSNDILTYADHQTTPSRPTGDLLNMIYWRVTKISIVQ